MPYTQSQNNRHNKSTQNRNRGTSIVVKNFPKNQTTFKHIKPEPQSYSEAVKSAKKIGDCCDCMLKTKNILSLKHQQIYWKCFPYVKLNQPNHQ